MPPHRIAVIGGGLTGLAAANRLIELSRERYTPLDLTLYEAGQALGGVIGTRRIGDYLVELGADSFITNKPWALDLCRRLGLENQLIGTNEQWRRSLVLRKGRAVPVPEGFMLIAPARVWPVLTSPIFSPWGKLRLGLEYFIPRRRDLDVDESLSSFVRRRFGREALDRLVQPLVGGIYTSDPEKLSLRATMPRFVEMEQQHGSLIRAMRREERRKDGGAHNDSGARYSLVATLAGGISELIDALVARVSQVAIIRTSTAVASIAPIGNRESVDGQEASSTSDPAPQARDSAGLGWEVKLADGTAEQYDGVIVAAPAPRAAELLSGVDANLAKLLSGIEYASSAVVITGHRRADVRHPLDAFGLVVPAIERRKILAVSFASRKFPGRAPEGRTLLRTFVGGAMQPELLDRSDEELVDLVRAELREILGVKGREEIALVARYPRSMPQYYVGHLQRVAEIRSRLSSHPGIVLAGNAYDGVGIPDCIHSGERAAEQLLSVVRPCPAQAETSG